MNPDIVLTEHNFTEIVSAALKENISLIIDLQGVSTSNKSKWLHIVSGCVEYLMANNQQHGLRHIFIEEAAEFCPQRPGPGGQLTYSRIESLARMGRNFGLGYTLINQRAEEVAKAVFEISELVLVHRQSGKNSLNSIKSWLDVRGLKDKGIVETLPNLANGECWAIDDKQEVKLSVLSKITFHPDPKKGLNTAPIENKINVGEFIKRMQGSIVDQPANSAKSISPQIQDGDVQKLKSQLKKSNELVVYWKNKHDDLCNNILKVVGKTPSEPIAENVPAVSKIQRESIPADKNVNIKSSSGIMRMLQAVAMFHPKPVSKQRVSTIAGMSPTSGTFGTHIATLKREGFITTDGSALLITPSGLSHAGPVNKLSTDPITLTEMWCDKIGKNSGAARILRHLVKKYPNACDKNDVGKATELSPNSGSFGTYISTLKRNDLINGQGKLLRASESLFG